MSRPPGTASRLTTGANRPMTKGANLPSQNLTLNPTKADDRPMTRGGLGGFQANTGGFNRQVQDKTYFVGLLRSKVNEINNEIVRMNKEMSNINNDNSNYLSYGKKAEELSTQIEEARGELADYNMVMERLNTASSVADLRTDYANLKAQNDQETKSLDLLFIEKGKKDEVVKRHEKEIGEEKYRREKILSSMSGPIRAQYEKIKIESDKLQEKMETYQGQLDDYKRKMETMKQQIGMSPVKQEALVLYDTLHNAELKRNQLVDETKNVLTPAEEAEKHLKQIKEDNQEITSIEKQVNDLKDQIESMKIELEERENAKDDPGLYEDDSQQKEISQKYRELRKREIQMDEFLASFEETKRNELDQLYSTRKQIINYLESMSKVVTRLKREGGGGALKSKNNKEESLTQADLRKLEEFETKAVNELEKLREKYMKMQEELILFGDLEGLKRRSENRKQQLQVEKQNLSRYKDHIKYELQQIQSQFEAIQAQLYDNETHNQLTNLEKKLQMLEQNNFTFKEHISSITAESDYEHLKSQVLVLVHEHNKWLEKQLLNPSNY